MPNGEPRRKPRFTRVRQANFLLQSRDFAILRHVYKHRFLTSRHIAALVSGSEQGVLRRLQKLFHGGYLDRPACQLRPWKIGTEPLVYGLGRKGANALSWAYGIDRFRADWTRNNRQAKNFYLYHTLMVAHFMVCLEIACRRIAGANLIEPEEISRRRAPKTYNPGNPFGWQVRGAQRSVHLDP